MIQLTENQWLTLVTVGKQGPISVMELKDMTGEPDTGERIRVQRLEELGLVKRQRTGKSGRGTGRTKISWQITDAGKLAVEEATKAGQ